MTKEEMLKDKLSNLSNGELMSLTNTVMQEEIQTSIEAHNNIKSSRSGASSSNMSSRPVTNNNRGRNNQLSQNRSGKAFEYKQKEEHKKPSTTPGIGLKGWDVDEFDNSENSDLNANMNASNASEDDWDDSDKKNLPTKPVAAQEDNRQRSSNFTYGEMDDSDESSDKSEPAEDDWGSFDF